MTSEERKQRPVFEGFMKYFPDAIMEISNHSFKANEKHNPGEPLHWAKEKSTDEASSLIRHLIDYAQGERTDDDGLSILSAIGWRAMAFVQRELETGQKCLSPQRHREISRHEIESVYDVRIPNEINP